MHTEREFIDVGTLASEIEDANFRVGHTAVEAGLGIWLEEKCQECLALQTRYIDRVRQQLGILV